MRLEDQEIGILRTLKIHIYRRSVWVHVFCPYISCDRSMVQHSYLKLCVFCSHTHYDTVVWWWCCCIEDWFSHILKGYLVQYGSKCLNECVSVFVALQQCQHSSVSCRVALVKNLSGSRISLYSIHAHPVNEHQFCVSGHDQYVRVYDRRCASLNFPVLKFCPRHLVSL